MYFKSLKSQTKEARECIDESLKKLQHHDGDEEEENSHKLTLKDLRKRFPHSFCSYSNKLLSRIEISKESHNLWYLPCRTKSVLWMLRNDNIYCNDFQRSRFVPLTDCIINYCRHNSNYWLDVCNCSC